jgi:DNA topoisomerase IB
MVVFDFVKRFFTDDFDTSKKYIRQFYGVYKQVMRLWQEKHRQEKNG